MSKLPLLKTLGILEISQFSTYNKHSEENAQTLNPSTTRWGDAHLPVLPSVSLSERVFCL